MPRLPPRVGVEQIHPLQAGIGQPLDHVERIAHMQPDIGQTAVAQMRQRADHAVQERLAPDEPGIRRRACLPRQMLARAEPDLELERPVVAE